MGGIDLERDSSLQVSWSVPFSHHVGSRESGVHSVERKEFGGYGKEEKGVLGEVGDFRYPC